MQNEEKKPLNAFIISMINIAAICNIGSLTIPASNGFSALFYLTIAALFFFIPVALVSAELASGWPQRGGVYVWVKEALGSRFGFLAIWMQWMENIIWYPTSLSFIVATSAYIFNPTLAENKLYIMIMVLTIFWVLTLINFLGMKFSGWFSTICALVGTLLPGLVIIAYGLIWILHGHPSYIQYSLNHLFPTSNTIQQLGCMAGLMLMLGGLEMSANHAKEVKNPRRTYPFAILISTVLILCIYSLGSLAIASVVPQEKLNLAAGSIEAFKTFFSYFDISWATPYMATLMSIGALGMVSTWIAGPTKGILATAEHGELPPLLQKTNKKSMPVALLLSQGIVMTIMSCVFLFMPTVSSSYWMLFNLAAILYLIMYLLMFISAIILRYKKPEVDRAFKIPGKNIGMWIASSCGILGSSFGIIMSFFPFESLQKINIIYYDIFLFVGIVFFVSISLIITHKKHPSWMPTKRSDK
jgi:putative glutamate/gamma-aminobutyrate antiporter